MKQVLLRAFGWLAVVPYLIVALLVLSGAPTWSGVGYVLGMGLLVVGLMSLPFDPTKARTLFGRRLPRGVARAGLVTIFAVMFVRGCSSGSSPELSFNGSARFVDRIVDERDIALSGTRVLVAGNALADDHAELPAAMKKAYEQMSAERGDVPSPVVATYLGLQSPSAYDMALIEPKRDGREPPTQAIIFLHGFAGNFILPCWQVAQAVADSNYLVACPSTRWVGDWSSANGEATLRDAVKTLRARGIQKFVLAGLSNGGYGASRLAPKMRGTFAGVILISGADPDEGSTGVPTLLIHGRKDSMAGFEDAVEYRAKHPGTKLVALDAGHFAMLVRSTESNQAIADFVRRCFSERSARRSP